MTQFNASSYDIQRPTGQCAKTGRELTVGETYFATLVDIPEQEIEKDENGKPVGSALGLKRLDVSTQAWEEGYRPPGLFSYWKSAIPEPSEKKKMFVDDAVLVNLLRRLGEDESPSRIGFRYVLALILMRKKLLRYDGTDKRPAEDPAPGSETGEAVTESWWRFTPKLDVSKGPLGKWNEEEEIQVLDPELTEDQIQGVTRQLGEVLEGEL